MERAAFERCVREYENTVFRIAVNYCRDYHDAEDITQEVFWRFYQRGKADLDAVRSLPVKYRSVIHLYYYEELSVREISQILLRREATVQTQLMRARKMLKLRLEEWHDE